VTNGGTTLPKTRCGSTLRLHESGLIKSNPKKTIAEKTDWRFRDELKRELKA
jgi:hypothetical protein